MWSAHARLAACAFVFGTSGCSLLNLDDLDNAGCHAHSDCDEANRELGIGAQACLVFRCDTELHRCTRQPRDDDDDGAIAPQCAAESSKKPLDCDDADPRATGTERCDGQDNDCDGRVDEGAFTDEPPESFGSPGDLDSNSTVSYAFGAEERTYIALDSSGWEVSAGSPSVQTPLAYKFTSSSGDSTWGCPINRQDLRGDCKITQPAIAAYTNHLIFAAVNTNGCATGQLRVGISDTTTRPFDIQLGKVGSDTFDESRVRYGVDLDPSGCTQSGATAPVVAVVEREGAAQAVALWIAATAAKAVTCEPTTAADVKAIGLVVRASSRGAWLDSMANEPALVLGQTVRRSPPALAISSSSSEGAEYLAAFAQAHGIRFALLHTSARTAPSQVVTDLGLQLSDLQADHLVLSAGRADDGATAPTFGLAWRSGCGDGARVNFVQMGWNRDDKLLSKQAEIALTAPGATVVQGPWLMYSQRGFTVSTQAGGWVVLWVEDNVEGQQLMAARIAERDNGMLGSYALAHERVEFVFPYQAQGSGLGYGWLRGSHGQLALGDAVCPVEMP